MPKLEQLLLAHPVADRAPLRALYDKAVGIWAGLDGAVGTVMVGGLDRRIYIEFNPDGTVKKIAAHTPPAPAQAA